MVHSICHIVAIHTWKSPFLVYLFTAGGEALISILITYIYIYFFKVERITRKMLHLNESLLTFHYSTLNRDLFKD